MKQTKQSILFSFVLAVMMLVGANTASGQTFSAGNTTVTPSANLILNDNAQTATVTVTLRDSNNNLFVTSSTVTLTPSTNGAAIDAGAGFGAAGAARTTGAVTTGIHVFTVKTAGAPIGNIVFTATTSIDAAAATAITQTATITAVNAITAGLTAHNATGGLVYQNAACTATQINDAITAIKAAGDAGEVKFYSNACSAAAAVSITTNTGEGKTLPLKFSSVSPALGGTTLTLTAGLTVGGGVTLTLGQGNNNFDVAVAAAGAVTINAASGTLATARAAGILALAGNGNVVHLNDADASLVNNGSITGSSAVLYSSTTNDEFWDNANPQNTAVASGVYYTDGTISGNGTFGNMFFKGGVTATQAGGTTFRINDASTVGILAGATLAAATTLRFESSLSASTKGTFTVRHYKGTITGGNSSSEFFVGGNLIVGGKVAPIWDNSASNAKITVLGDATFGAAAAAGVDILIATYTFPTSASGAATRLDVGGALTIIDATIETNGTPTTVVGGNVSIADDEFLARLSMTGGTALAPATVKSTTLTSLTVSGVVETTTDALSSGVLSVSGTLTIKNETTATTSTTVTGTLTIIETKTLTGIAITNRGSITNRGILTSAAFTNGSTSSTKAVTFTNDVMGLFTPTGTITNTRYASFDATITNNGKVNGLALTNNGGTIVNNAPSSANDNSGVWIAGTLTNTQVHGTATVNTRNSSASITNNGRMEIGTVSNLATITNNGMGSFTHSDGSTKTILGIFRTTGAFTNDVAVQTVGVNHTAYSGTFINDGTYSSSQNFINQGSFENKKSFNLTGSATFGNTKIVTAIGGGISDHVNDPTVVNSGKIQVATFTNTGGKVTNSDSLVVRVSYANNYAELNPLGAASSVARTTGETDNTASGVILAQKTSVDATDVTVTNNSDFKNKGTLRANVLTLTRPAAVSPYLAHTSSFTNSGTLVAANLSSATSTGYTNSAGSTTVNGTAAGAFTNAGTFTNSGGTATLPGATLTFVNTGGTITVSGGELSLGTGALVFTGSLGVTGGTATIDGVTNNEGGMQVSSAGNILVIGNMTNTATGTMTRGSTTASGTGTFVVRGTLTNAGTIVRTLGTTQTPAGDLTVALRAAQGTGYLAGVLAAAATDGIVVHGDFTNNAAYAGNVIVSSAASGAVTANARAVTSTAAFGGLTLSGDGIKTIANNITANQLFLLGGNLNAALVEGEATTTTRTVTVAGNDRPVNTTTQTFINGLSANGVFVGTDARWSDLVTVTMGTADKFVSLGQMTATLANGPLSVPAGTTQLVGDAFVKSAELTGKVNRLACFTFTTDVAMSTTSAGNVVVPDVCEVEEVEVTAVQIINNVAGSTYDVTFNGESFATDLAYQTATEVDLFEAGDATFVFTQGTTSYTFEVTLEESNPFSNDNYILIIQGGADGKAVELVMVPYARFLSNNAATMQFIFNHGVTNGPAVTVERVSTSTPRTLEQLIAVNATYGSVTQYLTQTEPSYTTLRMKAGGAVVGQYLFDFTGYNAQAVTLLATGRVGGAGANALMIIAVDAAGDVMRPAVTTSDDNDSDVAAEIPAEFTLNGNFPNPFNPTTNISFDLPEQANVRIEIIDLLGRQVMAIAPQSMSAGANKIITVDAARLSSGVYFYRLIAEGSTKTFVQGSKFTLVK